MRERRLLALLGPWVCPMIGLMGCATDETDTGSTTPTGDSSTGPVDPCEAPLGVTLGTGAASYVALAEGDDIELTWGEQGGFHLWTAAKLSGLDGPTILLHGRAQVVSTGEEFAGYLQPDIGMDVSQPQIGGGGIGGTYNVTTCTGSFWGQFTFVDTDYLPPSRFVCDLPGQEIEFSLDVTDLTSKEVATSTLRLIAASDPNPDSRCN